MVKYPKDNECDHRQTHEASDNIQGRATPRLVLPGGNAQRLVKVEHVILGSGEVPASWNRPNLSFTYQLLFIK